MRQSIVSCCVVVLLGGCGPGAPPPSGIQAAPQAPMPDATTTHAPAATSAGMPVAASVATPPPIGSAAFVDKVWRVGPHSGVEAGTSYVFQRDGTLRIDAPHGTPAIGQWRHVDGRLTMVEEGIAYPADIVTLDATHFVIRSHNPGGIVEIAMVADAKSPRP